MNTPCEALATRVQLEELRAELQTLRTQINNLLGQPEEEGAPVVNVLEAGTLQGTLVGSGLLYGLNLVLDDTANTGRMIATRLGGARQALAGATQGLTRIFTTGKATAAGLGALLSQNAGLIIDVASIGLAVTNLATIYVQGERIDSLENTVVNQQNAYNDIYSILIRANDNLEDAQEDINGLEGALLRQTENNQETRFNLDIVSGQVETLNERLGQSERNNRQVIRNFNVLNANFESFAANANQDIEILQENSRVLEQNLRTETENRERLTETVQTLGEFTATLQGRSTELGIEITRLNATQSIQRAQFQQFRTEVTNDVDLIDSRVTDLGARVALVERQVRRRGRVGGGVPANVQTSIANTVNNTGALATALAGNPGSVQSEDGNTTIPIPNNVTWQEILRGDNAWNQVLPRLIEQLPSLSSLEGGSVTPADIDAITANVSGEIDNRIDDWLTRGLQGAGVIGSLGLITSQTRPETFRAQVDQAVCNTVNANDGCIRTGLLNPITNNLSNIANAVGVGSSATSAVNSVRILDAVNETRQFLGQAWQSTPVQATMQGVQTVLLLHNAAMLSRSLGVTITETASLVANALPLENFIGENVDFTASTNNLVTRFLNATIGAETVQSLSQAFASANRILVAAQGMINAVEGMRNSVLEADEIISNRIGIGFNSLRIEGVVGQDIFQPMPTENNFTGRFNRFQNTVSGSREAIEEIGQLASSGSELVQQWAELRQQNDEFVSARDQLRQDTEMFVTNALALEEEEETQSSSPNVDRLDLLEVEPEEPNT